MGETLRHHLPAAQDNLTTLNPAKRPNQDQQWNTKGSEARQSTTRAARKTAETRFRQPAPADRWIQD
jgi:hypothetical protein